MFFPSRREAVESLQGSAGEAVTRHRNALVQLPASRTENRADGFGYAPLVADHTTDVFRMNSQFEDSHRLSLVRENMHFFWMVHNRIDDCMQLRHLDVVIHT